MTTTMIKTSVCNPTFPSLFYHPSTRTSFKNVSLQIPSGIHHPVSLQILSRALIPILIPHNQKATTPVTFKCGCAMGNFLAETKTERYLRLWNRARKVLTPWFIYMLFFWLIWMLPKWVFVVSSLALLMFIPLGESSKKMEPENISFDDLVGVEDAKVLFQEILHRVHNRKNKKLEMGIQIGDVVLLYGPEGTRKTTLVHALAREAKVPFFPVSAHDIARAEDGRKEIISLFIEARVSTPSIVYIKDIDAISRHRGNGDSVGTLRELCDEMEKCIEDGRVMVIATTDRPETLDPSLMSWFFCKVHVGRPNEDSRRKFIGLQLNKFLKEEEREAICNLVALRTPGFVWGDLRKIANISFMLADIRDDDYVTMDVVLQALEKVKSDIHDDKTERVVNDQMQHMVDTMEFGYQN